MKIYMVASASRHDFLVFQRVIQESPYPLRILMSFFYFPPDKFEQFTSMLDQSSVEIFADSGAFSAYTKRQSIDVGEYADWLDRYQHLFTHYVNLDDKTSWKRGLENLRYLEDRGLHPMPVYHITEPEELLRDLCAEYPYIGIGAVGYDPAPKIMIRNYARILRDYGDHTVFHLFGISNPRVMVSIPWYSVDSSTWVNPRRYGSLVIWDQGEFKYLYRDRHGKKLDLKTAGLIGVPLQTIHDALDRRDHVQLLVWNVMSWQKAEAWLTTHFGEVKIPERSTIQ